MIEVLSLVLQALLSVGLIVWGISIYASGNETYRTYLLILAGALWLVFDIYQMATHKKNQAKKQELPEQEKAFVQAMNADAPGQDDEHSTDAVSLPTPKLIKLTPAGNARADRFQVFLNGDPVGEASAKSPLVFQTALLKNVLHVENSSGEKSLPFFFEVVQDGSKEGALYIGFDSHNNLIILLSAGMVFSNIMNGIKKLDGTEPHIAHGGAE